MATQISKPIIHLFKEINKGKYKTTRHYELQEVKNGTSLLSNSINISKNQNCALSMPDYWLKIRQGKKWSKCITGLFKTPIAGCYKGDINRKQHLVLFIFSNNLETLSVYYFQNFYTRNMNLVLEKIRSFLTQ